MLICMNGWHCKHIQMMATAMLIWWRWYTIALILTLRYAFNAVKLLHKTGNRLRIIVCIPEKWIFDGNCLDGFFESLVPLNQPVNTLHMFYFHLIQLFYTWFRARIYYYCIQHLTIEQKREKESPIFACVFFQCELNHCINWKSNSFRPWIFRPDETNIANSKFMRWLTV